MPIKSKVRDALVGIASDLEHEVYQGDPEEQVIQSIIMPILEALGWKVHNRGMLRREYRIDTGKVDIALRNNAGSLVFIEAKAINKIDDDSEAQAFKYAAGEGVPLLILTDGREWNFYLPLSLGKRPDRKFHKLHISKEEHTLNECLEIFCTYLSHEEVVSGRAREKADNILQKRRDAKDEKEQSASRESMSQALKSIMAESSDLRDLLIEEAKRKYGVSPSSDMIDSFLSTQVPSSNVDSEVTLEESTEESNVATPTSNIPHDQIRSNDPFLNSRIRITGVSFKGEEHRLSSGIRVLVLALELFSKEDSSFLERFKQASMTSRGVARVSKNPDELFPEGYNDDNAGRCEQLAIPGGWWVYIGLSKSGCRSLLIKACKAMEVTYGEEFKVLT